MRKLNKQELATLEAVAERFRATWEKRVDHSGVHLRAVVRQVAVVIATLKRRGRGGANTAKPHLRFDKVATRLIENLRANLANTVPEGMTVVLTITAPIRLASKTAAAMEDRIQTLIGRGVQGRDLKGNIYGNRIRVRLLGSKSKLAPKMIGFVHNPETDALLLFDMTEDLLELISAHAGSRVTRLTGERWLVIISAEGASCLEAYRYVYSQLGMATNFERVLLVLVDGRVEDLTR